MTPSPSPLALNPTPATFQPDPIKDVGLATFMADVIEASKQAIIVVDFWAPWCGPCKQLGPALEKIVRSYKGAVRLAKIDIDQNPEIAQQMGVQSIPAVFAFYQTRPIDGFAGALPESQIKSWIEKLIKTTGMPVSPDAGGLDAALQQAAECLVAKDVPTAQAIYTDILDIEPTNATAYAGLLRCLMAMGDNTGARAMLDAAPPDISKHKDLIPIRTALDLVEQSSKSGSVTELQAKVEKDAADHQSRFDLAMAYYAAGAREKAVDQLLEIVRRNRAWNEDAARKQLVKFFEAFGPMDPLTVSSRKRLSSILFA